MTEKKEEKGRGAHKRLGEWKRINRIAQVDGVGEVPVTVVEVSYEGHTWCVPDTKEGRNIATVAIHALQDRAADMQRIRAMQRTLQKFPLNDVEGACRETAMAALTDLIDVMEKESRAW